MSDTLSDNLNWCLRKWSSRTPGGVSRNSEIAAPQARAADSGLSEKSDDLRGLAVFSLSGDWNNAIDWAHLDALWLVEVSGAFHTSVRIDFVDVFAGAH